MPPSLRTDFAIQQLGTSPFAGLLGKNTIKTDPTFGTRVVRVTDGSSGTGHNGSASLGNSGAVTNWNLDNTLMYFTNNGGVKFLVQFDPVTMQCTQLGGPSTNYSFAGAGSFSKVSPGVLYVFSPPGFPSAIQKLTYTFTAGTWVYTSTTTVCDFSNAAGGPLPVGYSPNWNSILTLANDDSIFSVGFSEGAQQTGFFVCLYKVGVGFRMLDTRDGTVTGSWGATGTATISSTHGLTFPFFLHDCQQFPNPAYTEISNTPGGGHIICWPNAGLTLVDGGNSSDHSGKGVLANYWNNLNGGAFSLYTSFDTKASIGTKAMEPGGQNPPQTLYGDPHYSLRPYDNDSNSLAWITFGKPIVFPLTACWMSEVVGFDVTGGVSGVPATMYRACHTYNSCEPTNNQGVAVASRTGQFVAFSSDMAGASTIGPLGSTSGAATGTVGTDARIDVFIVEIPFGNAAPTITSANNATFTQGILGSFDVTTTGSPLAAISESGSLPAGVTFVDNGNGTATLSGTPAASGTFPFTITAANGILPNATQPFALVVNTSTTIPPAITSASSSSFTSGVGGSFRVNTTGSPTPSLTKTGTLPSGVTFVDNANGTGTLAGTTSAIGTYTPTFTAANGVPPNAVQPFTLTVGPPIPRGVVTGKFLLPNGSPVVSGTYQWELFADAAQVPVALTVPVLVSGKLDANGNMTASLVFNDQLQTVFGFETMYQLTVKSKSGAQVWNESYFLTGTAANLNLILPGGPNG